MQAGVEHGPLSLRGWLRQAAALLAAAGVDSARLDAEVIAATVLGIDRARMLAGNHELGAGALNVLGQMLARRTDREPLAYVVGHKEFYSLKFKVTPEVLIPRPETELLVETALAAIGGRPRARVLDLGTGSGAIAIAIAANSRETTIVATDISLGALRCARDNARCLGCDSRIEFRHGDLWQALGATAEPFDLVVSNPPYIAEREYALLMPEVGRYEPGLALLGGDDGLLFYRRISQELGAYLKSGGEVIVEVGVGQAGEVAKMLTGAGCAAVGPIHDLAGRERLVRAVL